MATKHLPIPETFTCQTLKNGVELTNYIGQGKNGLVYRAIQEIAGHERSVAVKVVPLANLRKGWDKEIKKPHLLGQSIRVVRPEHVETVISPGETTAYVFIVMPWIEGCNLREYAKQFPQSVTHTFCTRIAQELLSLLHALVAKGISHGDIHPGNILVELPSEDRIESVEEFWLTDFGIGNSLNLLNPKDDFVSVAEVLEFLLLIARNRIVAGEGHFACDQIEEVLIQRLRDLDPSTPLYRDAKGMQRGLQERLESRSTRPQSVHRLDDPFDYMSCEQMGQKHELLQNLLRANFPNSPDFLEKGNTVLTGPRGCGKTMVLRSLASKSCVLGQAISAAELDRFGIYYHCTDLFYAFPYSRKAQLDQRFLEGTLQYFSLSLLAETLASIEEIADGDSEVSLSVEVQGDIISWVASCLPVIRIRDRSATGLGDLRAQVGSARLAVKYNMQQQDSVLEQPLLSLDFITTMLHTLCDIVPWLRELPSYVFLDDYSTPRVSAPLQASLNRIIFQRWERTFFKVATESITSLHPYDSEGKLLEEDREYSVIDLGTSFMTARTEDRRRFISEVVNTRFENVEGKRLPPLERLLGDGGASYNEMARLLRSPGGFKYRGLDVVVDMCSGDITHTLRLIRDMVAQAGGVAQLVAADRKQFPIEEAIQNRTILKLGADFLANIEAAPGHGPLIRKIADAFGEIAHWELMHLDSPNQDRKPPAKQAFRIEIREALEFHESETQIQDVYEALLRYGIFIRDATGRSLRSIVVDRLYLRRLLIPIFRLTFSRRDNIGLEVADFKRLLNEPERFKKQELRKRRNKQVGMAHRKLGFEGEQME